MKKFETGKKYLIYFLKKGGEVAGILTVIKRTKCYVTYSDDFFGRTKKVKVTEENGTEKISGFYIGVFAEDVVE